MKDFSCRCSNPQEILINFLGGGVMPLFELRNLTNIKDTTQTVRQHKSTETDQQNFVKLCSYKGHNVQICIFTGNADLIFLRSNLYPFCTLAKIMLCNSDETDFLLDCPPLMLEIAIRCIQHSQAMLERGVCKFFLSLFLSLFNKNSIVCTVYKQCLPQY